MERLDKILANTGRWSRKEARELVRAGRVAVDGVTAQAADGKYDPAARFEVDGETVSGERLVYLMLHKPAGLVSATEDPRQPTVLELLHSICAGWGSSRRDGWTRTPKALFS